MSYANTDGSTLKMVEETTFNTTPTNSTNWKTVRAKGWSMKPAIATVESEELSANVDVRDVITATKNAQVSLTMEYSKDAVIETFFEHLFRSAFTTNILKGGILAKSMTLEEAMVGTATEYGSTAGFRVDQIQLSGRVGQIAELAVTGTGAAAAFAATSLVGTGTLAAAGTNRALTLADLTSFTMTGDVTTLCVTDFSLTIQNQTRLQFGAGSQSIQGIGYGTRRVTGSFTAYFETREQFTKFNSGTKSDLNFVFSDGTNSHTWRLPAIKYTDGERAVSGRSADIMQKFSFTATYDGTTATTAMITRTP